MERRASLPDSLHLRYEGRLTADVMLGLGQAIHERGLVCHVASYGDE